jgi:hypothetical protein
MACPAVPLSLIRCRRCVILYPPDIPLNSLRLFFSFIFTFEMPVSCYYLSNRSFIKHFSTQSPAPERPSLMFVFISRYFFEHSFLLSESRKALICQSIPPSVLIQTTEQLVYAYYYTKIKKALTVMFQILTMMFNPAWTRFRNPAA